MKYRKLGRSDLEVSEVSLGSWLTYGGGVARERAEACVRRAFDVGINFIDTANVYSGGAAESFLGEVLAGRPRESYVLATKVFFPMPSGDRGLSAAQIEKQLDASLRRLRTDHVDLYQCHRYDPDTPLEETMAALTRAVRGRQDPLHRLLGVDRRPDPGRARAARASASSRASRSTRCSGASRRRRSSRSAPGRASARSSGARSRQGILAGKYLPGQPVPADSRAASPEMGGFIQRRLDPATLAGVQRLHPIAAELGLTLSQLAHRLGAAPAGGLVGHHRRVAAGAGRGERPGVGRDAGPLRHRSRRAGAGG